MGNTGNKTVELSRYSSNGELDGKNGQYLD